MAGGARGEQGERPGWEAPGGARLSANTAASENAGRRGLAKGTVITPVFWGRAGDVTTTAGTNAQQPLSPLPSSGSGA